MIKKILALLKVVKHENVTKVIGILETEQERIDSIQARYREKNRVKLREKNKLLKRAKRNEDTILQPATTEHK